MNNLFASLFLILSLAGCATIASQEPTMADAAASLQPEIIQSLPLQAAVLITPEMERNTYTGKAQAGFIAGSSFTFPVGRMIKSNAINMFSPVFSRTIQAKGSPYPEGTDLVVTASVVNIKHWHTSTPLFNVDAYATATVKVSVYDTRGKLLWERVIDSPRTSEITYPNSITRTAAEEDRARTLEIVANESVVLCLREAAKEMASAVELHAYAENKGKPSGTLANLSVETASPVRSDIDGLPVMRARKNSRAYAIVIGIENYRQKLPKADYATQDAMLVAEYLTQTLGYQDENVVLLTNDRALQSDFTKYFEKWLPNNVETGSTVFVYYSGHGAPNTKTGDAYLVPYDGDPSFIDETGYSLKRMYAALGKLPAKEIIVALDSCFSGAGGRSVIAKGSRPLVMNLQSNVVLSKNMTVLSASSGDQTSSTYDEKGHGLFTYFMLKGIKNEDVVRKDGSLDIAGLYDYVKPQVSGIARKKFNNEQTPQLLEPKR